jgi:hypothetical protein
VTKREEEYEGHMAKVGGHFAEAENTGSALVGREMTKVDVPYVILSQPIFGCGCLLLYGQWALDSRLQQVQSSRSTGPGGGGRASANDARGSKKKLLPVY